MRPGVRLAPVPVDRPAQLDALLDQIETLAGQLSAGEALVAVERAVRVELTLRGRYLGLAAAPEKPSDPSGPVAPRLLDVESAAAYLSISRATLLRRVKDGRIPALHPSTGTTRFDRRDLDAFAESLRPCTIPGQEGRSIR